MKLLIVSSLLLVFIVSCATAQMQRCYGRQWWPSCWGGVNRGHGGAGCNKQRLWYYDGRQCRSLHYWGCGGNNNRWCSRDACQRSCRRSG